MIRFKAQKKRHPVRFPVGRPGFFAERPEDGRQGTVSGPSGGGLCIYNKAFSPVILDRYHRECYTSQR